jgi:hypothetical protein
MSGPHAQPPAAIISAIFAAFGLFLGGVCGQFIKQHKGDLRQ